MDISFLGTQEGLHKLQHASLASADGEKKPFKSAATVRVLSKEKTISIRGLFSLSFAVIYNDRVCRYREIQKSVKTQLPLCYSYSV